METERLLLIMERGRFDNFTEILNLLRNRRADPNVVTMDTAETFPMRMCNEFDDSHLARDSFECITANIILRSFLEHPRFDINYVSPITRECILTIACSKHHSDLMRMVLDDPRLVVTPAITSTCMDLVTLGPGNVLEKLQVLMGNNKIAPTYWKRIDLCLVVPLFDWSEAGHTTRDIQDLLLENITDFNIQRPENGNTPLHEVGSNVETCELLLARGANPLIRNARGETALDTAQRLFGGTWRAPAIIQVLANAIKPHLRTVMMSARRSVAPDCASIIGRYAAEGYGFKSP
jgi:hypothetical protein